MECEFIRIYGYIYDIINVIIIVSKHLLVAIRMGFDNEYFISKYNKNGWRYRWASKSNKCFC